VTKFQDRTNNLSSCICYLEWPETRRCLSIAAFQLCFSLYHQ